MTGGRPRKVVVVTGASSGIGRGVVRALLARGDGVVLLARSGSDLDAVVTEYAGLPGRSLPIPTDVADEPAVLAAAARAVEVFGRIDAWVNCASVWSYGTFENTPPEVFGRIIETNLLGAAHGARAALSVFRTQGSGVLLNVASVYGHLTTPYVAPYVASKWALVGLTHVLRQELADAPGISVCLVSPGAVDTPIYRHGANYVGRRMRPLPPVVPTARVVRAIVKGVDDPRREIVVGWVHRTGIAAQRLAPGLYDRLVIPVVNHLALQDVTVEAHDGNVFDSDVRGLTGVQDGWRRHDLRTVGRALLVGGSAAGAVGVATRVALRFRGRGTHPSRAG